MPAETLYLAGCLFLVLAVPITMLLLPRRPEGKRWVDHVLFAVLLGALGILIYEIDAAYAVTVSWISCGVLVILTVALSLPAFLRMRSKVVLGGVVALSIGIGALHFTELTPVKPYSRFFAAAQVGMTRQEIIENLTVAFPEGGRFSRPVIFRDGRDGMSLALDLTEAAYNAEVIGLRFKEGRLIGKEYMMD